MISFKSQNNFNNSTTFSIKIFLSGNIIGIICLATAVSAASYRPATLPCTKSFVRCDDYVSFCTSSIPFCILKLRSGADEDEYDEYDENSYDSDDEEDDYSSRPTFDRRRREMPSRRPPVPMPSPKNRKHWSHRMASKALQKGGNLAWNTVKQPGKLAYHLIRPKYVDLRETGGLWRLDQQITMKGDRLIASVATIEMNPRQRLVLIRHEEKRKGTDKNNGKAKEKVIKQPYTFTKSKLGTFMTSFVAPAFLIGDTPRLYGYKGSWQRKVADSKVIKLVGNIYEVKRQRFGKGKGSYVFVGKPVGTFVARRRIQMAEDEEDEYDEYDDEYDTNPEDEQDSQGYYERENYDDDSYDLE
jgi:hypothetical protein